MGKSNRTERLALLIEGYLEYLTDVGRKSPRTVIDVRCTLKRVCQVLAGLKLDQPLEKLSLTDYLRWIEQEREQGRSALSLNKQLSHVRGYLNYAWRSGRADRNVLDGFQLQDASRACEPESLTLDEAERLIKGCSAGSIVERRDRVVVLLLYGCGVRTHELCALTIPSVDPLRKELKVDVAKGDRPRIVPVPGVVHTELLAYLLERGARRGPLFRATGRNRPLSSKEVCEIVSAAAQRAKITWKVTPKTLRHSYATHLMDCGVDVAVIARLMGHRSPQETGVYLHVLKGRTQEAVDRLPCRTELPHGASPEPGDTSS
ncbi:MAG: tyrosine-type recombinase/integrase [Planctomycetes bacterium]|nr:tyrosine-type recombinase/integrase [Planctomycetota bacterium]